jgi:hypothetical protein
VAFLHGVIGRGEPAQRRRQGDGDATDLAQIAARQREDVEQGIAAGLEGLHVFLRQRDAREAPGLFAEREGNAHRLAVVDADADPGGQQRLERRDDDRGGHHVLGFDQRHAHAEHRDGVVLFVEQKLEHLAAFGLTLLGGGDAAQFPVVEDLRHVGRPGFAVGVLGQRHAGQGERDEGRRGRKVGKSIGYSGHWIGFLGRLACFH